MKKVCSIIFSYDLEALKLILFASSILWSLLLLWPGETFGRPTYEMMSKVMDEITWGVAFLLHGVIGLSSRISKIKGVLYVNNLMGSFLWLGSSVLMLLSVYPPPAAISGELVLSLASVWLFIRTDS
jgi:hypothetical protein